MTGVEAIVLLRHNRARESAGLEPLVRRMDLDRLALKWSEVQRAKQKMQHNTRLSKQMTDYLKWGENVGYTNEGPIRMMAAWMNSLHHRANILDPDFTECGIGAVRDNRGVTWWTVVFRKPS